LRGEKGKESGEYPVSPGGRATPFEKKGEWGENTPSRGASHPFYKKGNGEGNNFVAILSQKSRKKVAKKSQLYSILLVKTEKR